jgi:hypothetical protein
MRSKPVTRDEIRFNGSRITTLPVNSVREGEGHLEAIESLWAPLLHELNREHKAPKPITCPRPDDYGGTCSCRRCGCEFWRVYRGSRLYCSDKCAGLARQSKMLAARSEARAKARAGRTCLHCGKPIEAQRSTRQYCNNAHRIAAYRERQKVDAR